ncbi:MAG: ornithine carbamoyltransferase [Acidimicrobiales bacterium]
MRHLLEVDDLSEADLVSVLAAAANRRPERILEGRGVALIFEKPSNRTRNAFEMAVVALGGHPVAIRGEEIGIATRESVEDVTRVLSRYHAIVAARVVEHASLEGMASVDAVPVVNLLSELSHPSQAVADLLTMQQRWGTLKGRRVAWVGDANNVARSLVVACSMVGVDVAVASPRGYELDEATLDAARSRGVTVEVTTDPYSAVGGVDAVCTDVWVSMGQEDEAAERVEAFKGFCVTEELMLRAEPDAVFMHCLPAHRGMEVEASVIDGPRSAVWDQAENRMHAARAICEWVVSE